MDVLTSFVDGIKSDRLGHVKGYLVRFGDSKATDLEGDYFTKATDYGFPLEEGKRVPLNVYYHHGMDSTVGKKSIGSGFIKMDSEGLWYEAQLDMADEYGKMIAKLCKQGKMGFSSGAAAHMVERKSMGGASEIIRWPIAEASITPTPAEYRNSVKSLEEYYGMGEMEDDEEMMPEPMPEQSPEEYAAELFKIAEADLIHEGMEAYYEAMSEGIGMVADASMAEAIINEFANRAKQLYAMHGAKCIQPASLRGVERRLRDAVGLSRSAAKRLAPVVWDSLRDADQPEVQPDLVVEAKAHDNDERAELLARLELLKQL
jgi:beta-phosphoglucomutase-like phosphatase (HAD superfamily)